MSEFKGTKDTWILDKEGYIKTKEGFTIAYFFIISEQDLVNATLASKAPEMLEMLKKHLGILYDIQMEDSGDNIYVKNLIFETKQLIKQATEL